MIDNCFFAKVNEDGTYGDPIPVSGVKEINIDTSSPYEPIPNYMLWNGEFECKLENAYQFMKELAWTMLNLKRSSRHLVSKNIWGR